MYGSNQRGVPTRVLAFILVPFWAAVALGPVNRFHPEPKGPQRRGSGAQPQPRGAFRQALRATKRGARLLHEGRTEESGNPGQSGTGRGGWVVETQSLRNSLILVHTIHTIFSTHPGGDDQKAHNFPHTNPEKDS